MYHRQFCEQMQRCQYQPQQKQQQQKRHHIHHRVGRRLQRGGHHSAQQRLARLLRLLHGAVHQLRQGIPLEAEGRQHLAGVVGVALGRQPLLQLLRKDRFQPSGRRLRQLSGDPAGQQQCRHHYDNACQCLYKALPPAQHQADQQQCQ